MTELRQQIDDMIESELKRHISVIGATSDTLLMLGEIVEKFYQDGQLMGDTLTTGMKIIVGAILQKDVNTTVTPELDKARMENLMEAIQFGSDYFCLREMIYYSYSQPDAIAYERQEDTIVVKVNDGTIFRQYMAATISVVANSTVKSFQQIASDEQICEALLGTKEFEFDNEQVQWAIKELGKVAEFKLNLYYRFLSDDSSIDIGGYAYKDFLSVYKELLNYAMYQRYYAMANSLSNVISLPEAEFAGQCFNITGISIPVVRNILQDLAKVSEGTFISVAKAELYYLLPTAFSLRDMLRNRLRLLATQYPQIYSSNVANIVGENLVIKLKSYFASFSNFRVRANVSLAKFSSDLPDIDLMTVSYEPSMGFHFLLCEVKNPIPANWAKEYLKGAGPDGFLTKALEQSKNLSKFVETFEGVNFFKNLVLTLFNDLDIKRLFPTGFCMPISQVIITSQSIGMFYPDIKTTVVSESLFKHIVQNSDGDICYITGLLNSLHKTIDESIEIGHRELTIAGQKLKYDVCKLKHLVKFVPNSYLSVGALQALEKEAVTTGYSYINQLPRPNMTDFAIFKKIPPDKSGE